VAVPGHSNVTEPTAGFLLRLGKYHLAAPEDGRTPPPVCGARRSRRFTVQKTGDDGLKSSASFSADIEAA
jgi:hypothetical protein